MTPLSSEEIERIAHKRAGAKLGWYVHAAVYVVVNLFLFAISGYGFGHRPWSIYPLLGWGLGLALARHLGVPAGSRRRPARAAGAAGTRAAAAAPRRLVNRPA